MRMSVLSFEGKGIIYLYGTPPPRKSNTELNMNTEYALRFMNIQFKFCIFAMLLLSKNKGRSSYTIWN